MTSPGCVTTRDGMVHVRVRAVPGASRTALAGAHGDAVKVRLAAAPEKGKANAELEAFLSAVLGIAKSGVSVVKGHASRDKVVEIRGVSAEEAIAALCPGDFQPRES